MSDISDSSNCIRSSDCALPLPDFPSNFLTNPSNHQIIRHWDAGFTYFIANLMIHNYFSAKLINHVCKQNNLFGLILKHKQFKC